MFLLFMHCYKKKKTDNKRKKKQKINTGRKKKERIEKINKKPFKV